jgi:hypothetical protein
MRRIEIFFYGLFMDRDALIRRGFKPGPSCVGLVADFKLKIGERATLAPAEQGTVWGVTMDLPSVEAERLYAEPSVADYRPEAVLVHLVNGDAVAALCYNLLDPDIGKTNKLYAEALYELAVNLGLPEAYLVSLKTFST